MKRRSFFQKRRWKKHSRLFITDDV